MFVGALKTGEQRTMRTFDERRRLMTDLTRTRGFDMKITRMDQIGDRLIQRQISMIDDRRTNFLSATFHGTRAIARAIPFLFQTTCA